MRADGSFPRLIGWSLLSSLVSFTLSVFTPCDAQMGGGIGFGQQDLYRQIRFAAKAMREYRCAHKNLPQQIQEQDKALRYVFSRVSFTKPDPAIWPLSRNNFRYYYQFQISYDPSIMGIPCIQGKYIVPQSWSAPPNTIVIMTDGADTFMVWASDADNKPISDPTTGNPLIIKETVECPEQQPQQ